MVCCNSLKCYQKTNNEVGPLNGILGEIARSFRSCWKQLILTDIAYKIIAFVLLTPLVAILFRAFIAVSGSQVLADQDILLFFLGPVGWGCLVIVGALWLGIEVVKLATLMAILATSPQERFGVLDALRFASACAWPVFQLLARLIALMLFVVAPFLAAGALVYFTLFSEYDINYYLQDKPRAFWVALGIIALIVVSVSAISLRLLTGWFLALPIVVFEDVRPANALRLSRGRAQGQRGAIFVWILGWALTMTAVSALATTLTYGLGRLLIPLASSSLGSMTLAIGAYLLVGAIVGLTVNLLSMTSFATIYFHLYQRFGAEESKQAIRPERTGDIWHSLGVRLTTRRLTAGAVLAVVAASAIGLFAIHSVRLDDHVQIIAHRGSSHAAPENTLAAVHKAIVDGADWVEVDVQETADGNVVIFHDSDFMRLSGVDLKIWNATMTDLEDIDVGSWFDVTFEQERVPTLDEILKQCRGRIRVNIELKYYGHDDQLEQRVAQIVDAHGMAQDVVVMTLKTDAIAKMKSVRPDWKVGLLMSIAAGNLQNVQADFLAVNAKFANRRFIQAAHQSSKEVYVWTVNDIVTMSTMIGRGVDGLITDDPALARAVLQERTRLSAPERLLVELAGGFGVVREVSEQ